MKRLLVIFMALVVMMACAGCGGDDKKQETAPAPAASEQKAEKAGALMPIGLDEEGYKHWTESIAESEGQPAGYTAPSTVIFFDNMNSMIMALKGKQIDRFAAPGKVGAYIVARNEEFQLINNNLKPILGYSMAMNEKDKAQIEEIDAAIKAMKDDGTLNKLIKENITDLAGADPVATEIPMIEGADTLKVAVTGDMPALDCILADGKPAGFNVAFLGELSKRINKNFELVDIEAGARGAALSSGQVDILFWVLGTYDEDGKALPYPLDDMKGVAISIPYMMDNRVGVTLK